MLIGLMMVNEENDILPETLPRHAEMVDALYVLDGTVDNTDSELLLMDYADFYTTDAEAVTGPVRDGSRQVLLEQAVADHGHDHWFLLLHADEIWDFDPMAVAREWMDADGLGFRLPFYVPRQEWDPERGIEQLEWRLSPGWPEFRMFRGGPEVAFAPSQHNSTQPSGLNRVIWTKYTIRHYPYRSPESQLARALAHQRTGFDLANYRHALNGRFVWTDEMVGQAMCEFHRELVAA